MSERKLIKATYESSAQYQMEGPILDVVSYLQRTNTQAKKEGWTDIQVEWGYTEYSYSDQERCLKIVGMRPETDQEQQERLKREEAQREAQARQEENDRETYKRLKARFEPEET